MNFKVYPFSVDFKLALVHYEYTLLEQGRITRANSTEGKRKLCSPPGFDFELSRLALFGEDFFHYCLFEYHSVDHKLPEYTSDLALAPKPQQIA